ncbi:MAG: T9SS type A sorting domain-containing protein [Bacteroidota bacterium]|nr:T9SS type A sorting domain-containing protein [Bacteroidota bacterium]
MKKQLLTVCGALLCSLTLFGQQVPNGSFEQWETTIFGETPIGWQNSDMGYSFFDTSANTVEQSMDAQDGTSAVWLTADSATIIFPGLFPGVVLTQYTSASRYGKLTGYYKGVFPPNNHGIVHVSFTMADSAGGSRDTVAQGMLNITQGDSVYQMFEVPLMYDSIFGTMSHDSVNIEIGYYAESGDSIGYMLVDNLNFEGYPTGILTSSIKVNNIYPNPASSVATVSFAVNNPGNGNIAVYDMTGRKVAGTGNKFYSAGEHQLQLNVTDLINGIYQVSVTVNDESTQQRIVVSK